MVGLDKEWERKSWDLKICGISIKKYIFFYKIYNFRFGNQCGIVLIVTVDPD